MPKARGSYGAHSAIGADERQRRARNAAGLEPLRNCYLSSDAEYPIVTFTCERCGCTNAIALKPNKVVRSSCEHCGVRR